MTRDTAAGLKVLVVEDYDDARLMMRIKLEHLGYRVVEAADGEDAVEAAWRECPDVVLMDLSLPKLDGLEAAKRIRTDPQMKGVVIVAVTALSEPQFRQNALSAGMDAFVTKPIDFGLLDDLLKSLAGGR